MGDEESGQSHGESEPLGDLSDWVSALTEQTCAAVATQVNTALKLMNRQMWHLINTEVLAEQRAGYDQEIVATLSRQLTERYGRGLDCPNLYRMIKFAQVFRDHEIVVSLGHHLSWTHFRVILSVYSDEARTFCIRQTLDARFSVRALCELIGRQGFESREIANAQNPGGSSDTRHIQRTVFPENPRAQGHLRIARPQRRAHQRDGSIPPRSRQRMDSRSREQIELLEMHRTARSWPNIRRRCHREWGCSGGSRRSTSQRKNESRAAHSDRLVMTRTRNE